jgi:hypothetical protein
MTRCWVSDIEEKLPDDLAHQSFDALIFSQVLEQLRDLAKVPIGSLTTRPIGAGGCHMDNPVTEVQYLKSQAPVQKTGATSSLTADNRAERLPCSIEPPRTIAHRL